MFSSRSCGDCIYYDTSPPVYRGSHEGNRYLPDDSALAGQCTKAAPPFTQSCVAVCSCHTRVTDRWWHDAVCPWQALARYHYLSQKALDHQAQITDTGYVLRGALRLAWMAILRVESASLILEEHLQPVIEQHTETWREAARLNHPPPDGMILPLEDNPRFWESKFRNLITPAHAATRALTHLRERFTSIKSLWDQLHDEA